MQRGRRGVPSRRGEGHADQGTRRCSTRAWTTVRCRSIAESGGARRAGVGSRHVLGDARGRDRADVLARARRVHPAGARRGQRRPRRSTCRAIRPTCTCRPGSSCAARPRTAGRRSRRRCSRARRPRCGGPRTTARRPTTPARDVRLLSEVKSIVTIGDADVRLLSLRERRRSCRARRRRSPSRFPPATRSSASAARRSSARKRRPAGSTLFVSDPAVRRHQFLVSLERQHAGGSFKLDTGFPTLPAAQRETGEVAVEGLGTLEVTSPEIPGLRRMDVRELDPSLAAVARQALLAAYRYQRTADAPPALSLDVRRFADAEVLAAVAERAVATTLVTHRRARADRGHDVGPQPRAGVHEGRAAPRARRCCRWKSAARRRNRSKGRTAAACRCCVRASVRKGSTWCRSSTSTPGRRS